MSLTEEQNKELTDAARPLIAWLNNHGHPHMKVIVENDGLELVEGLIYRPLQDYLKD